MRQQIYDEVLTLWAKVPLTQESFASAENLRAWLGYDDGLFTLEQVLAHYNDRNVQALRGVLGFHPQVDSKLNVTDRLGAVAAIYGRTEPMSARRWARRGAEFIADYILQRQFNFRSSLIVVSRPPTESRWNIAVSTWDLYKSWGLSDGGTVDNFLYDPPEPIRNMVLEYRTDLHEHRVELAFDAISGGDDSGFEVSVGTERDYLIGSLTWVGQMDWSFNVGSGLTPDNGERYYDSECSATRRGFMFSVSGHNWPAGISASSSGTAH